MENQTFLKIENQTFLKIEGGSLFFARCEVKGGFKKNKALLIE